MTWPEILERIDSGCAAAILPLGATEQHGPQLGCGMDAVLADKLSAEVARRTGVPALPVLPYTCSIGHSHRWPGTVALSPTTLIAVLCDLADWLHRAGIRRLFLVNCHVGNRSAIGCAVDTLRCRYDDLMLGDFNVGTLTPDIEAAFSTDAEDWHANAAETSLMLALAPEMVRRELLDSSDDPDRTGDCVLTHPVNRTSLNGVTGKPSEASESGGERLFEQLVDALCSRIEVGLEERPPLEHSYFNRIHTRDTR
ncbi:MAG: creatininase family protein [Verrucomicrobiota bacterium]